MGLATTDPVTGQPRDPNVVSQPSSNAEFLANQLQSNGYFQLGDDEALVLTIDPGNAGYFIVPVYNDWTITDNYWDQQTSLNNAQAEANDGRDLHRGDLQKGSRRDELGLHRRAEPGHDRHPVPEPRPRQRELASHCRPTGGATRSGGKLLRG